MKVRGTKGDDTLTAGRNDKVFGRGGDDHIYIEGHGAMVKGGPGADTFYFLDGKMGFIRDYQVGIDTVVVEDHNGTTEFFAEGDRLNADFDGLVVDGPKFLVSTVAVFIKSSDQFSMDDLLIV